MNDIDQTLSRISEPIGFGRLTLSAAKRKLADIATRHNGTLSTSGRFVNLPGNDDIVGYGAVRHPKVGWMMVSIPR